MKTCNSGLHCNYRTVNTGGYGCNYEGICNYQCPYISPIPNDTYKISYQSLSDILLQEVIKELKEIKEAIKSLPK